MLRVTEHFERTDTGRERRVNEDSYFARSPVFVVADGMGGAQAGEVASRMAIELFESGLPEGESGPEQRLADRAREANRRIFELARHDAHRAGMGTTLTAAYVGEQDVSIAHVGDSRAYRMRDGELEQLTDDHSLVWELVKQEKITREEAEDHPQRSIITRALGPEAYVEVDTFSFSARDGDVYLLNSDGLTSMIAEDRLGDILRSEKSLADAGRALIAAANEAGGRDNITVILFRIGDVGEDVVDQPTLVGAEAPRAETVLAQLPDGPSAPEQEDRERTVAAPVREARTPRARTTSAARAAPPPRRRSPRWAKSLLAVGALLGLVAAGGWLAIQSVYFIGTSREGLVTVFRGLPYDLPAGIHLYSTSFVSGVASSRLAPGRRRSLLDHKLRSHDDAADLVRRLELGELAAR